MTTLFLLAVTLFVPVQSFAAEEIRICPGESTTERIFKPVIPSFEKKTNIKVIIPIDPKKFGAFDTLKMVIDEKCEATANAVDFNSWMDLMKEKGVNVDSSTLTSRVIGRDYVTFFMSKALGLRKLKVAQISSIFTGKIQNWKDLGGPDRPIQIIASKVKAGTISMLKKKILNNQEFPEKVQWETTYEDVISKVSKANGAIGFLSGRNKNPEVVTVETEEEIGRPITLVTKGKPSDSLQKLLNFIANEGKALVEK